MWVVGNGATTHTCHTHVDREDTRTLSHTPTHTYMYMQMQIIITVLVVFTEFSTNIKKV